MNSWEECLSILQDNKHKTFFVNHEGTEYTYQMLLQHVERMSTILESKVPDGEIAWIGKNNFLFYVVVLSCIKCRRPVFIFYNSWKQKQISENIVKNKITNILFDAEVNVNLSDDEKEYVNLFRVTETDMEGISETAISGHTNAKVDIFLATSGTTGTNKWVGHSCHFILQNMKKLASRVQFTSDDCIHSILPLYTSNGMTITFFLPFSMGATIFQDFLVSPFTLSELFHRGHMHHATVLSLVPSIISMMNRINWDVETETVDRSLYKFCICGTAPLSEKEREAFQSRFGVPVYTNYGLTEVLFVASQNALYHGVGSSGQLLDGVRIHCDNEIQIEKPEDSLIYLNQEEDSDFFFTGDLGEVQEGELYITGRKKQIAICGGYNVNTNAVEEIIHSLEGIQDVVCFGLEKDIQGEELIAAVVLDKHVEKVDYVRDYISEHYPAYMVPKIIRMRKIPRNDVGKPDYRLLKQMIIEKDIAKIQKESLYTLKSKGN